MVPASGGSKVSGGEGIEPTSPASLPPASPSPIFCACPNVEHLGGPLICVSPFPGRLECVHFIGERTETQRKRTGWSILASAGNPGLQMDTLNHLQAGAVAHLTSSTKGPPSSLGPWSYPTSFPPAPGRTALHVGAHFFQFCTRIRVTVNVTFSILQSGLASFLTPARSQQTFFL